MSPPHDGDASESPLWSQDSPSRNRRRYERQWRMWRWRQAGPTESDVYESDVSSSGGTTGHTHKRARRKRRTAASKFKQYQVQEIDFDKQAHLEGHTAVQCRCKVPNCPSAGTFEVSAPAMCWAVATFSGRNTALPETCPRCRLRRDQVFKGAAFANRASSTTCLLSPAATRAPTAELSTRLRCCYYPERASTGARKLRQVIFLAARAASVPFSHTLAPRPPCSHCTTRYAAVLTGVLHFRTKEFSKRRA